MIENYDHVILVKNLVNFNKTTNWNSCASIITNTFKSYLGERILKIECHEKSEKFNFYLIGLILNQDMLYITTDNGPTYGTVEAVKFKELWGEMSQVVHVNGNVYERVTWPRKKNLTMTIVNFIMKEKLGFGDQCVKGDWYQIHSDQFGNFLRRFPMFKSKIENPTIEEAYDVLSTYMTIGTTPGDLKKIPIHINEMRPVGSWSKHTNVFNERAISINGFNRSVEIDQINPVYDVALIVEANNKWPSDLDALKLMKTLFVSKISELLHTEKRIYSKVLKDGRIDILVKGFVFRCFLVIRKELLILKRLYNDREVSLIGKRKARNNNADHYLNEKLLNIPKPIRDHMFKHEKIMEINAHIRCYSAQLGAVYVDTCRLVKRWLSCQHIDLIEDNDSRILDTYLVTDDSNRNLLVGWCFTEIAVELLVTNLFIHPNSRYHRAPQSVLCGFLRFLKLMSGHDWVKKPLVLNVNDGFSEKHYTDLCQSFKESDNRHTQLPMLVIRTPNNKHGDFWTNPGPNSCMLEYVKEISKQAYVAAKHLLVTGTDLKPLFTVDTSRFDVLFHLNESYFNLICDESVNVTKAEISKLIQEKKQLKSVEKLYQMFPKDYDDNPIAKLIKCIRSIVETEAVCSFDKYGGRFIALQWIKKDTDKDFIIKSICNFGKKFIEKCEILK